jgi:SAM-dependent methyltransferase
LGEMAYRRICSRFVRRINPKPEERCVDFGCGSGAFTRRLRPLGLKLLGIDISPNLIELANAHKEGESYRVGDVMSTGIPDDSFDIVVYSGILHHFPTTEIRLDVLKEGHRLLRPGGRVFGYDPNLCSPSMWLYRHPSSPFYSSEGKTDNEVLFSSGQLRRELSLAGFREVQVDGLSGTTYRFVESAQARMLLPVYNLYEIAMMLTPLQKAFGTFLISSGVK